ncbi:MAG: U32 family peptidase [Oscillibacter sp.]|jgi:putative protease|nr:U32 family peptidase [Oscillibacter sp.]
MELLSPAGSPESLRAAVTCGADAVYLGWGEFNARRNAKNFTDEEFAQALRFCRERGVRVYLTLNTLLSDRELPTALETARRASDLGADAVLVQDWGLFTLLRRTLPDLPLHASTQMSIFTSGGAREAAAMGCRRIVLARECSREDAAAARDCGAEIELFGHGALCMCYSGQCAMSALIGGRSGNRGKCAQPCRLPYGIDGPAKGGHPLSLKDACLACSLRQMEETGAACLKLEGRMKRPEYVAVVTSIYARLLRERRLPTGEETAALEQAFSRQGFTDWYWRGKKGPGMFGSRPEDAPEPKALFAAARAAYETDCPPTVPVRLSLSVRQGRPAELTADDGCGRSVTVSGPAPEPARTRAVTGEELAARLSKTGGTPYFCPHPEVTAEEGLSLSAAAVNALRREALSALSDARCAVPPRRENPVPPLPEADCSAAAPEWTVSAASFFQITPELLALGPARVFLPLSALASVPALPQFGGTWCAVLPRVWRDGDEPALRRALERAQTLGVRAAAVGNLGHLPLVRGTGLALYGDFGLNVFNSRSLEFLAEAGLSSACVSFELRFAQIRDLAKLLPAEAIVYGRLPLMITENCLIQNALGCACGAGGPEIPAAGRCAGSHYLCDRTGARFPLLPAYGHRTEIENSLPLYLGDRRRSWSSLGLAFARLRFTSESPEECVRVFRAYRDETAPRGPFTRGLYQRGVE